MRIKDRIRAFMLDYRVGGKKLTGTRFAAILQTPYGTFEHWLRTKDKEPPGCLTTLMDILERSEEARALVGIEPASEKSRCSPLPKEPDR